MINSAEIILVDKISEIKITWFLFDGDDSFNGHDIIIGKRVFNFGPCHVSGYKKWINFFDGKIEKIDSGFMNPDLKTYKVMKINDFISFEISESNIKYIHEQNDPIISIDKGFHNEHWD